VRHSDAAAVIDALAGASRGVVVSLWGINTAHALSRLAALGTASGGAVQGLALSLAHAVDVVVRLNSGVAASRCRSPSSSRPPPAPTTESMSTAAVPPSPPTTPRTAHHRVSQQPKLAGFLRQHRVQGAECRCPQRLLNL
jgi:hypothetical protein